MVQFSQGANDWLQNKSSGATGQPGTQSIQTSGFSPTAQQWLTTNTSRPNTPSAPTPVKPNIISQVITSAENLGSQIVKGIQFSFTKPTQKAPSFSQASPEAMSSMIVQQPGQQPTQNQSNLP